jgi:hypothetical protein
MKLSKPKVPPRRAAMQVPRVLGERTVPDPNEYEHFHGWVVELVSNLCEIGTSAGEDRKARKSFLIASELYFCLILLNFVR